MTSRPIVLLVEGDRDLRKILLLALRGEGYDVVESATGLQALTRAQEVPPDLMLLDVGLPDVDGVDIISSLRKHHHFPIIALSAPRGEEHHIRVLDAGAEAYVTKPIRQGELMARMRALLRAAGGREYRELGVGDLRIDPGDHRAFLKNVEVKLTPIEFKLLHILLSEAGRVVKHDALLCAVWGPTFKNQVQYLRVYMRQLRMKVEENAARPQRILTAPRVGYRVAR